jgi:hypothetical protein
VAQRGVGTLASLMIKARFPQDFSQVAPNAGDWAILGHGASITALTGVWRPA